MRHVVLLSILVLAEPAAAFSINVVSAGGAPRQVRWGHNPVHLALDKTGAPAISGGSDLVAVRAAIKSWNDVRCSAFRLEEDAATVAPEGTTSSGFEDGRNIVSWSKAGFSEGSPILAVTATLSHPSTGAIHEADITFNDRHTWSTDGSAKDIEVVAVHELGHFLGAQHVVEGGSVMAPSTDGNLAGRKLTADDEAAVCYLYPREPHGCRADTDCPRVLDHADNQVAPLPKCVSGRCDGLPQLPVVAGPPEDGAAAKACGCDLGPGCDGDCLCDRECVGVCECDASTACDDDCSCDPECQGGCAASPASRAGVSGLVVLGGVLSFWFGVRLARRTRRR